MSESQQALRTGHVTCLGALGNSFGDLIGVGSFGGKRTALYRPKALSILCTPLGSSLLLTHGDVISLAIVNYKILPKKRVPLLINCSSLPNKSSALHLVFPAGRMRAPAVRAPAQVRVQAPANSRSRSASSLLWTSGSAPLRLSGG